MSPIRILIADDHPIVRDGIRALLAAQSDTVLVGEAGDGAELWEMLRAGTAVDVLILDMNMPSFGRPVRQIAALRAEFPSLTLLILSAHRDLEVIRAAMEAGAGGYITKNTLSESLVDGIRHVARGKRYFSPDVVSLLFDDLSRAGSGELSLQRQLAELTERERDVIRLVGAGLRTQSIADQLGISAATVQVHVRNAYDKLGVHSRAEVAAIAVHCQLWGIGL